MSSEEPPPPEAQGPRSPDDVRAIAPLAQLLSRGRPAELLRRLESHRSRDSRLHVEKKLAAGGMGEIHRVREADLERELAMKTLPGWLDECTPEERERRLARFLEEAQVTGQLNHPGIVPVHELSVDEQGRPFFTMPLVRGRDLTDVIRLVHANSEGWTTTRTLGVLLKVCEAVAYAHSRGVIHRDLKPSNVRIGRFGETYVMDWGLARVLGRPDVRDLRLEDEGASRSSAVLTERARQRQENPDSPLVTMDGDVVGTPHYMSPEQARGEIEKLDARSDVYSLGAMLYHVLVGRPPYSAPNARLSPRTVLAQVVQGPPRRLRELVPDAPEELVEIAEKAMDRDPARRYADMLEMAADIEAFLDRRPVRAHAPSLGYALGLAMERNKLVVRTAAVGALLLLASGVYSYLHLRGVRLEQERTRQARADVLAARALRGQADELFPAVPAKSAEMRRWLDSVTDLFSRERADSGPATPAPTVADAASPARVDGLASDLKALHELLPRVSERLRSAESLERLSIEDEAKTWNQAIADIASLPAYHGLQIRPQLGLVPLWRSPQSGLWEFWHVNSGSRPTEFDRGTGRIRMREEDGIVLVLLPGGEAALGSAPDRTPTLETNEGFRIRNLAPFLIGKFEVSQGQWLRAMGENPARFCPADTHSGSLDLLHPIESVNWIECSTFARREGLELPTEDQWEYACRAGTVTEYFWGDDAASLQGHENVFDQSAPDKIRQPRAAWRDGFPYHAPIDALDPNSFGLHNMHGNVSEWCEGVYLPDPLAPPGPEAELTTCMHLRVFRGGTWYHPPNTGTATPLRSAFRQWGDPKTSNSSLGLRVASRVNG